MLSNEQPVGRETVSPYTNMVEGWKSREKGTGLLQDSNPRTQRKGRYENVKHPHGQTPPTQENEPFPSLQLDML